MAYEYYQEINCQYDEFIAKGICSINPSLSAMQEIILIYLKELAYYLLKLKDLGAHNDVIKERIIEAISGIMTNIDYNECHFQSVLLELSEDLSQAKTLYANLCYKNNFETKFLDSGFKHAKHLSVSDIIRHGEKYYIKRNTEYSSEQKNFFDIMLFLVKNICLKILQIKSFERNYDEAYDAILTLLNTMNLEIMETDGIKKVISQSLSVHRELMSLLSNLQEERYGKRESVYIPFTPRNGKAILVSGIDMTQLEAILEATKGKGIDVYTHGMLMLMAHTLPKFKSYPHLVGHFGKGIDNSLFDFAAFPGAILMTQYLFQKIDYLYKGRLFTTDEFAPSGIIKIENNNFEPLIQAALASKGFSKSQQEIIHRVGFRQQVLEEKTQELIEKMEKKEIKQLFFIGILHQNHDYEEYFKNFFKILPKNCYAISLAYEKNEENILHVDSFYDYLLIYKVLEKLNEKKPLSELPITIFITKCDQYTISNLINFKELGVKNIYAGKCIPSLINPAMAETMRKTFGVKNLTTPQQDLKETLSE